MGTFPRAPPADAPEAKARDPLGAGNPASSKHWRIGPAGARVAPGFYRADSGFTGDPAGGRLSGLPRVEPIMHN
jgi:hypothetical protein